MSEESMIKTITDKIDNLTAGVLIYFSAASIFGGMVSHDIKTKLTWLEQKLSSVQQVVVEKEVPKPVFPDVQIGNVVGGPLPDKYFVIGQDENGNEQRVYLSIDGKLVEDYFK